MPANAVLAGVLAGLLLYQRDAARSEPAAESTAPTPRGQRRAERC